MDKIYEKLLNDSRWLRKRQIILNRDGYCTVCGSNKYLQVHHTYYYQQPTPPWEYPDNDLITLCHECHHAWHDQNELVFVDKPHKNNKSFRKKKKFNKKPHKQKPIKIIKKKKPSLASLQSRKPKYKPRIPR